MPEELELKLEELGIDSEKIPEILSTINVPSKKINGLTPEDRIHQLKNELINASGWRKRVAIRARIISERLDV